MKLVVLPQLLLLLVLPGVQPEILRAADVPAAVAGWPKLQIPTKAQASDLAAPCAYDRGDGEHGPPCGQKDGEPAVHGA